jgi:serine phosphatase RsbU (regulator of sigma subunit)
MAWLVALDEGLGGRRFSLDAPCLVGRGPYNHVVLNDNRISRQHAKISPESGGHVVYDLNSANGTYVNDVQVKRQKLAPNDVVRFGPFSFKFESGAEVGRPSSPRVRSEELTRRGFEPPAKIVGSMDASASLLPAVTAGLNELEDSARKLRVLYAFMQSISATLDTGELLQRILSSLLDVFPSALLVGAYLIEPGGHSGELVPRLLRRDGGPVQPLALPAQFHEEVVGRGRSVLSAPMTSLSWDDGGTGGGTSMHVPLIHRSYSLGVLHVRGSEASGAPFNQGDLDLCTAIAAQAAMALQNARLHQESLKQQRLQQDLLLAEQIQKSFLPSQLPAVRGIEFITDYRPAYSVGGDFYDVFWLARDKLAVFIGDVSGKGVSAALLMARVSSDLRAAAMVEVEPARVLASVNRAVVERNQPDIFVTAIYLTLDTRSHKMEIANAGHLPPIIRRANGDIERVDGGTGTAIGIFDDAEYEQADVTLAPGDTMVLCTDGVLEATNAQGAQFGFEGLESSLGGGPARAADLAERLHGHLRTHVGDAPQYDDLTLIVCGIGTEESLGDEPSPTSTPISWRSMGPLSDLTLRPPPPRE